VGGKERKDPLERENIKTVIQGNEAGRKGNVEKTMGGKARTRSSVEVVPVEARVHRKLGFDD